MCDGLYDIITINDWKDWVSGRYLAYVVLLVGLDRVGNLVTDLCSVLPISLLGYVTVFRTAMRTGFYVLEHI